jgi:hypothetical protein
VTLHVNSTNELAIQATTPNGQSTTVMHRIRHDPRSGQAAEPPPADIIRPTMPRNILLGMKEDRVAKLIEQGVTLPYTGRADHFLCEANSMSFTLRGPIFEGHMPEHEIPYAPFNTRIGELQLQCPPTPTDTPLVVEFEVDDSRTITVRCWFRDQPHVKGQVRLECKSIPREEMHLIERVEMSLDQAGERLRPDERSRISRKKQLLNDLCKQYAANPNEETRKQIIQVSNELKSDIKGVEQKYKL